MYVLMYLILVGVMYLLPMYLSLRPRLKIQKFCGRHMCVALQVGDQRGAGLRLLPRDAARRARRGVLRRGRGGRGRLQVSGG